MSHGMARQLGISDEQTTSALELALVLWVDGVRVPKDVYPLPDGNVLFEWRSVVGQG